MATDEQINDAIQAYLTEQAYGSGPETDGLMIAAAAGWKMLREENAALRGRVAVLTEALTPFGAVDPGEDTGDDDAWFVDDVELGRAGWTYGAVRRARATLAATEQSDGGRRERERAVIEASRALIGRIPQQPTPHGLRPAVMDESGPIRALWDAVKALDAAPDGAGMPERGASGEGT